MNLTERQAEILSLAAAGCTCIAIAHRLGIRPATVEASLGVVRKKLDAVNTTAAVATAIATGLISAPAGPRRSQTIGNPMDGH